MSFIKKINNTPILKNISANSFGVIVTLFNQVLMVPIFLSQWGVDKYGDWIVLTSLASFLTMSDIGLNSVTANQYTICYAEGKNDECNILLTNNYFLLSILSLFFVIISSLYLYFGDINTDFNVRVTDINVTRLVLFILVLKVFITMFGTVMNAVYRAVSLFSKAVFLDNIGRLAETVLLLIGIIYNLDLRWIVIMMSSPSLFLFIYKRYNTRKYINYQISHKNLDFPLLKNNILPSIAFMSFPIGNAIVSQGFTLVVNNLMGANILILFNTTRTMVNFMKQIINTISIATWPELSIAYGKKDFGKMRNLHRYSVAATTLINVFLAIIIMFIGKYVYQIWTHGKIEFNSYLMLSFLIVLIVNNGWYTSSMSLMATNKHSRLGLYYFILSICSLILLYGLLSFYPKIELAPLCLLLIDLIPSVRVLSKVLSLTNDTWINFSKGISNQLSSITIWLLRIKT